MNFSIRPTIRRLLAPHHKLSCSWLLWRCLVTKLRERGNGATRESGAFLLGSEADGAKRIVDFILYDDLDRHALDTGIVRFDGAYFGELWDICRRRGFSVVADIHVHPGSVHQSDSDMQHPMISLAGHVALILPNFAIGPMRARAVGIYRYLGAKRWDPVAPHARSTFLHIGI